MIKAHREDEANRLAYEQQCQAKFDEQRAQLIKEHDKLVSTIKENSEADRARLEAQHAEATAAMQQQIVDFEDGQRKQYEEKVETYNQQITAQREQLEGEFREAQE